MNPTKNNPSCHSHKNGNPAKTSVYHKTFAFEAMSTYTRGWRKMNGFTLVELIVVITILVILGTIAFTSLGGYSGNARDSSRVSDLTNLSKGLDIAYIKTSSYPTPDNPFNVTYSGWTIWTQGTIGDTVMNIIGANGAKMNKKPTDPLSTTKEYTYSKLAYGNAYQIKADWEGDSVVFHSPHPYALIPSSSEKDQRGVFGIPEAQAASGNPTLAYIKGTYNGLVAKTQTGATTCILALPSIITNTGSANQTIALETNNLLSGSLLIHNRNLSGTSFKPALTGQGNPIVYCSGSLPSTTAEQRTFATNLANAYSGTVLATNPNIQPFISALSDANSGTLLTSLGGGMVSASLGVGASASYVPPATPTYSCIGALITANATISNTTGLTTDTAYQTTTSGNGCYYTCKANYSGTNCEIYTAPIPAWTTLDTNCTKPDITIGSRVWAGCNSTLGTMATAGKNLYNSTCYNYAGADANTTACQSATAKENWAGITTNTAYAPTQTNNIYGKLYQFDTDIKASGKCSTKTIGGQTVYGGGTDCACPTGWHIPSNIEWTELSTALNGGVSCEVDNTWACSGLGWINQNGRNSSNSIIKALGVPLAGNCYSGSCYVRGNNAYYWSSTESGTSAWRQGFVFANNSVYRSTDAQTNAFSVRCLKDY